MVNKSVKPDRPAAIQGALGEWLSAQRERVEHDLDAFVGFRRSRWQRDAS
jgi:hypothetical protein